MADFTDFDDTLDYKRKSRRYGTQMGGITAAAFGLIGVYQYINGQDYLDQGHLYIAPVLLLSLVGIFLSFKNYKLFLGVIFVLISASCIFVIAKKNEWQSAYEKELRSTAPFMFHAYVDRYPTWEEYTFPGVFKAPDWVRFTKECAKPVLGNKPPGPSCKTLEAIENKYYIDMRSVLAAYLKRMQNTAKSIDRKKIKKPADYQKCVDRRKCAEIPLLPDGINPESIDPASDAYLDIRRPFWQLINGKEITPEICDFMLLCHVLEEAGAVNFER